MKAKLDCIPCVLRQAVNAARLSTDDEELIYRAIDGALETMRAVDLQDTPMAIGSQVHGIVGDITGEADPYLDLKRQSNEQALEMYPYLREIVSGADDPLVTATKISIAGNIMDFGALDTFDVESTVQNALESDFAIDDFDALKARLGPDANVLFIADNAGEIVFDRVLMEHLQTSEITVAVKSAPFINDATLEDAKEAGIDGVARLIEVAPGAPNGDELDPAWEAADAIIAKGQGNYEVFSEAEGPLFFLLIAKCECIADDIGVNKGDTILQSQETRQA
ncbi:MAG: damage-control phosphatase ARMT1 family protein [Armatimonadota bacterium]